MSKELDIAVARALGYRVVRDAQNVRGVQVGTAGRKGHDLPYYSEDYALIPVLLAWIEAHGLCDTYIDALLPDYHSFEPMSKPDLFALLRATPEQHCRAFIACTQGDKA